MTETKIAKASQKALKSSPIKVMKITKNITGLKVSEALTILKFSKLKLSSTIREVIYSAMSNAENNHNMDADNLYVKEINVGRAFALKRFSARGRGKSSRILKTYSNLTVIVGEKMVTDKKINKNEEK
ncbi:MAG: 50S ribosomal protein L22 [Proteobacteria bacterium]|jgi:large subunit ribosomal protein L22|nr:50S ribosomal protein L22 [Pseudomonadota bacterium]NCA27758.1 50S ribosomal protein L22 [Pseudomonadota bacterium]